MIFLKAGVFLAVGVFLVAEGIWFGGVFGVVLHGGRCGDLETFFAGILVLL